jgi:hypothetical protein
MSAQAESAGFDAGRDAYRPHVFSSSSLVELPSVASIGSRQVDGPSCRSPDQWCGVDPRLRARWFQEGTRTRLVVLRRPAEGEALGLSGPFAGRL